MVLRALISDVDGTLADSERDGHRVAFNLAFAGAAAVLDHPGEPDRPCAALWGAPMNGAALLDLLSRLYAA